MIRVYHFPTHLMSTFGHEEKKLRRVVTENIALYHLVAEVATDDLDEAVKLTSTIDDQWWRNQRVTFLGSADHGDQGCRSTSVGDVLERTGVNCIVSGSGFIPYTKSNTGVGS